MSYVMDIRVEAPPAQLATVWQWLDIAPSQLACATEGNWHSFAPAQSDLIEQVRGRSRIYIWYVMVFIKCEVGALGVTTISRGCFERCCSNKKTPRYHSNLSFATLRNWRPTLLRAPAYRTPSEASPRRRCGHASRFLRLSNSG